MRDLQSGVLRVASHINSLRSPESLQNVTSNWRKPLLTFWLRTLGRPILAQLDLARSIERASPEALRRLQQERLTLLLSHAANQCDYYRAILRDADVISEGKVDLERFWELPFLTKDILTVEGPRLRAESIPKGRAPFRNRTGGSTGEPAEFWQDSHYHAANTANKLYYFESLGKKPGQPELKIWGSKRDILLDNTGWLTGVRNYLYNRKIEGCATLGEERLREIVATIDRFHPRVIWAYVDGMTAVAEYVVDREICLPSPAAVFCGGGTLYEHMRQVIEEAFRCPVINYYGSRELGAVACQCERGGGLHTTSHSHLVEVVDGRGHAVVEQEGDIVVTSLTNYAMPFIRYWTGDRGALTERNCECGRVFPMLKHVSGRTIESFVKRNGEVVSSIHLGTLVGANLRRGLVSKFQLVQEEYDRVRIRIVPGPKATRSELDKRLGQLAEKIGGLMGTCCVVTWETVESIPPAASGKFMPTLCRVAKRNQSQAPVEGAGHA